MASIETLIASLFYLMTRHQKAGTPELAAAIQQHFRLLAEHPECKSSTIRETARRLGFEWLQESRIKELGLESPVLPHRKPQITH